MSLLDAVRIRALHLPSFGLRKWQRVKPLETFADVAQSYAHAAAIPYLITFGIDPHATATDRRDRQSAED